MELVIFRQLWITFRHSVYAEYNPQIQCARVGGHNLYPLDMVGGVSITLYMGCLRGKLRQITCLVDDGMVYKTQYLENSKKPHYISLCIVPLILCILAVVLCILAVAVVPLIYSCCYSCCSSYLLLFLLLFYSLLLTSILSYLDTLTLLPLYSIWYCIWFQF